MSVLQDIVDSLAADACSASGGATTFMMISPHDDLLPRCDHQARLAAIGTPVWTAMAQHRQARRALDPRDWAPWCWMPMALTAAVIARLRRVSHVPPAAVAAALAPWREEQAIYRFSAARQREALAGAVSVDLSLHRFIGLSARGVYLELPDLPWTEPDLVIRGAYVHLECDVTRGGRPELRLLLDAGDALVPVALHLGPWSLEESIARAVDQARVAAVLHGRSITTSGMRLIERTRRCVRPILHLVLLLCEDGVDIRDRGGVAHGAFRSPLKSERRAPVHGPSIWMVR